MSIMGTVYDLERDKALGTDRDSLLKENSELRAALDKLVKSSRPCPHCPPEAECYIFSMVALAEASEALSG